MFTEKLQFPLSLILTHRRGVGIMICKNKSDLNSILSNESIFFEKMKTNFKLVDSKYESFFINQILFSRVIAKTAENLYEIFHQSLEKSELSPQDIKTMIVGVGPGSFTGLRLGCAFVNGLKMGIKNLNLLPVSTYLTPELLYNCRLNTCEDTCLQQLGEYELEDESTGYVTFFDLFLCLKKSIAEDRSFVGSLSPEYGKEPGPVLKLREGNTL